MSAQTFVITVADSPKSVNQGGGGVRAPHWSSAYREKVAWQNIFMAELMVEGVPRNMTHCSAHVTVRFKHRNHRDVENYRHPVIKPLADALVAGGWLEDDTEEWFEVEDFRLEHADSWPERSLVKSELVIRLHAHYA